MSVSKDLSFQDLSTVQSDRQPTIPTIASAATVAPTTFITYISGTVAIATVTPPANGQHMLILVFTTGTPTTFATTGNVSQAIVPTSALPTFLFYDPAAATYTGCASNLS